MAKLTYSRARNPLFDDSEVQLSAGGRGEGQWVEFGIRLPCFDKHDRPASYSLKFNRAEAERIATYFREMLDQKIDSYGRPV